MAAAEHHHRSTTKVSHKPFKSRHASKNALKDRLKGKVERGVRKTPHQHMMSKLDRRNHAKQKRLTNHAQHLKASSIFAGKDGAPRIIAVVPLCDDVSAAEAVNKLNSSVDLEGKAPAEGILRVHIDRFKQNIAYVTARRDIFSVLDTCSMADYVVFVLSATQEVDQFGEMLLKAAESQGISNVVASVQNLELIDVAKKRTQVLTSLKSFMCHFFPTLEKVNSLDSGQECQNVIRVLCTTSPKGVIWRETRSWMMVEDVRWPSSKIPVDGSAATGEVVLTGVVRGNPLKSDRLVQLGDWGDFQIDKITSASPSVRQSAKSEEMVVDEEVHGANLEQPTEDQDDLAELAPEEIVMEDVDHAALSAAASERRGVLIDDHHYFSDEDAQISESKPKKLPRGTSKYQAAWYLDGVSDSGSDLEDVDDDAEDMNLDMPAHPADGIEDVNMVEPTEAGPSDYPQSEIFLDPSPEDEADQIAAYRAQRQKEAKDDLEFPDEIEIPPNVLARERLAKYRGLKSLRTSRWETEEDRLYEPEEWRRLLEVADYKAARNRVMKEALVGGIAPGTRVHLHLRDVPLANQNSHNPSRPLALFSLLRHEHKRAAVNFSITLNSDVDMTVRSKETLVMQCGPRRFVINPLFSLPGTTPNDVHKFHRYLHPGQTAVASFTAPLTWGSVPTLYFKSSNDSMDMTAAESLRLIGTGTSLAPSHSRVIAKRIILTGHPFKLHKRVVTVRYMFFNAEDIAWFKALQLWTRRGRSGYIKESLGTHGYFKATFDGRINSMDAVAVSLYKRVWPRPAKTWKVGEVPELIDVGNHEGNISEI